MIILAFIIIFLIAAMLTKLIKFSIKVGSKFILVLGLIILTYYLFLNRSNILQDGVGWIENLLPNIANTISLYLERIIIFIKIKVNNILQFIEQLIFGGAY